MEGFELRLVGPIVFLSGRLPVDGAQPAEEEMKVTIHMHITATTIAVELQLFLAKQKKLHWMFQTSVMI